MPKEKLSPHITYEEATKTNTGLKNDPTPEQLENMKQLAYNVFEPLRLHFGTPIRINSFFRSAEVNKVVKGAINSQHMANNGAAIDIDNDGFEPTNKQIFDYIKDNLNFDQLIWEFGGKWIHVSYAKNNNRKQVLNIV